VIALSGSTGFGGNQVEDALSDFIAEFGPPQYYAEQTNQGGFAYFGSLHAHYVIRSDGVMRVDRLGMVAK